MKIITDNFIFNSDFDNGNLHKVIEVEEFQPITSNSEVTKKPEFQDILNSIKGLKLRTIPLQDIQGNSKKETYNKYEVAHVKRFCLWTKPDAYDSGANVKNRTWFHFSVKECVPLNSKISTPKESKGFKNDDELLEEFNTSKSSIDNNSSQKKEKKLDNDILEGKKNESKNNEENVVIGHWTILQFRIMNLNIVSRLFNAGMRPVWCSSADKKWKRIAKAPLYEKVDKNLQLTFEITIPPYTKDNITYYFAYCIPYSYSDLQDRLLALKIDYLNYINNQNTNDCKEKDTIYNNINSKKKNTSIKNNFQNKNTINKTSLMINPKYFWDHLLENKNYDNKKESKFCYNDIYFNHRILIHSNNNLNLDLITISSTKDMILDEYEDSNILELFPSQNEENIHMFKYSNSFISSSVDDMIANEKKKKFNTDIKKKIIFISARVHPGEVVSSYIMDGIIEFLLRDNDIRSKMLRDKYVFKIVPMLNPDGVMDGNYRTDQNGFNLNRVYKNPNKTLHPTIWAVKKYISYLSTIADIEYYIDFHGHANKFGYFTFGNHFFKYPFNNYGGNAESSKRFLYDFISQTKSYAFAKLCSLNNKHFSILNCDFSNKNMDLYKSKVPSYYSNNSSSNETLNSTIKLSKQGSNTEKNSIDINNDYINIEDINDNDKFTISNNINKIINNNKNNNNDKNNEDDNNINKNNDDDKNSNDNNKNNDDKNSNDNNKNNDDNIINNDDSNKKSEDSHILDSYIPHSKIGSGRVTMYREFKIMHAYTIEANYYCSKEIHEITLSEDINCSSPTPISKHLYNKPYSINTMMSMGHGVLCSILEMNYNPSDTNYTEKKWSRLATSPLKNIDNVISWSIEQSEQLLRNTCKETVSPSFKKLVHKLLTVPTSKNESLSGESKTTKVEKSNNKTENKLQKDSKITISSYTFENKTKYNMNDNDNNISTSNSINYSSSSSIGINNNISHKYLKNKNEDIDQVVYNKMDDNKTKSNDEQNKNENDNKIDTNDLINSSLTNKNKETLKKELNQKHNEKQNFIKINKNISNDNVSIKVQKNKNSPNINNDLNHSKEKRIIKSEIFNINKYNEIQENNNKRISLNQNNNRYTNDHRLIYKPSQIFGNNNVYNNIYNLSMISSSSDEININDTNFIYEESEKLSQKNDINHSPSDIELEKKILLLSKFNQDVNLSYDNLEESNYDIKEETIENSLVNIRKIPNKSKKKHKRRNEKRKDSLDQSKYNISRTSSSSKENLFKKRNEKVLKVKKTIKKDNKKILNATDSLVSINSINSINDDSIILNKIQNATKLKKKIKKKKIKKRKRKEKIIIE